MAQERTVDDVILITWPTIRIASAQKLVGNQGGFKHGAGSVKNVAVFVFNNTVLLMNMRMTIEIMSHERI